jgi:putative oxidoreductase
MSDYEPPEVDSFVYRYSDEALSLLRVVAGLLFFLHGTSKLFMFPPFPMGHPSIFTLIWVAGVLELIGGALLIVGLFSRPAAFLLAGEMAYAYWTVHAPQSPFPTENGGEAAVLYCFIFLFIAAAGPGRWSLDVKLRGARTLSVDNTADIGRARGDDFPDVA